MGASGTVPYRRSGGSAISDWVTVDASQRSEQLSRNRNADEETEFVRANYQKILRLICRIVRNQEDAQDLTQETFIKAWRRHEQLKDVARSSNWLSRIAINTAFDFMRRKKHWLMIDDASIGKSLSSPCENAEQLLLRGERLSYLDNGLATLTTRERTALTLRDVEGLPAGQVALEMNCAMATVRSHVANARTKFKRYLEGGE